MARDTGGPTMERRDNDIERRSRLVSGGWTGSGPVVYWMSRDQRINDNWALLKAQQEAMLHDRGLVVVFCLVDDFPHAEQRAYHFLLTGLAELQRGLAQLQISLVMVHGDPAEVLVPWLRQIDAHSLIGDFDPLRIKRRWQRQIAAAVDLPFYEVDAHNVIPAWIASTKREYAAATFRPKFRRLVDDFLTEIPPPIRHPSASGVMAPPIEVNQVLTRIHNRRAAPVSWLKPGAQAGHEAMRRALTERLPGYATRRNNPCLDGQSALSPYLHFGQISAQRLALLVTGSNLADEDRQAFLEELLVRRELADNFCLYETEYDRFSAFPEWARISLDKHRQDRRDYRYRLDELEHAATHEALWNACQQDLVSSGKLHGYLRMYWAKKILEWTSDPEEALDAAITLNDRYSLDGRDPNGFTGIAWSIGGVHDRAWPERPIFGKIRFMNERGCRRKFDVDAYIAGVARR